MKIQSHTYFIWCVFWRAEASMGEHTFSQRGRSSHWTTWNKKPEMVPRKATEVGNEIPNLFHCTAAFFSVLNFLTSFIFVGYETLHAYVRCCWNHSFSAFFSLVGHSLWKINKKSHFTTIWPKRDTFIFKVKMLCIFASPKSMCNYSPFERKYLKHLDSFI